MSPCNYLLLWPFLLSFHLQHPFGPLQFTQVYFISAHQTGRSGLIQFTSVWPSLSPIVSVWYKKLSGLYIFCFVLVTFVRCNLFILFSFAQFFFSFIYYSLVGLGCMTNGFLYFSLTITTAIL